MKKRSPFHEMIDSTLRDALKPFRKQAQQSGLSGAQLAVLDAKLASFREKSLRSIDVRLSAVLQEIEVEMIQVFEQEFGKMTRH